MAKKTEDIFKEMGMSKKDIIKIKAMKDTSVPTLTIDIKKREKEQRKKDAVEIKRQLKEMRVKLPSAQKITSLKDEKYFEKMFGKKAAETVSKEERKAEAKSFALGKMTPWDERKFKMGVAKEAESKARLAMVRKLAKAKVGKKGVKIAYQSPFSAKRSTIQPPINIVQPEGEFFEGLGQGAKADDFKMSNSDLADVAPTKQYSEFTKKQIILGQQGRGRPKKIENLSNQELAARVSALRQREAMEQQLAQERFPKEQFMSGEQEDIGLDIDVLGWKQKTRTPSIDLAPPSLDLGGDGLDIGLGNNIGFGNNNKKKKKNGALNIDFW